MLCYKRLQWKAIVQVRFAYDDSANPLSMKLRLLVIRKWTHLLLAVVTLVALSLTLVSSRTATVLETVRREKALRIITFVGPTTYFENAKGQNGFEYFLARAFADSLGVELQVTLIDDLDALFNAIGGPRGHFAGAGLTVTDKRQQWLRFSTPYNSVRQTLVYRLAKRRPTSIADIGNHRILVVANSSHEEKLTQLRADYPKLQWLALRDTEMLELMRLVHEGETDYAVVDSTAFSIDRSLYPNVRAAFDLTPDEAIGWAFPKHGDTSLLTAANNFLRDYQASGNLQRLKDQFFGHTDEFSVGGSLLLMSRINQRLVKYQALFETVAKQYGLDWRLLAAMAYQESHWNPDATSPTGVRGMMMLTLGTASEIDVEDRLDPEQSIRGGAEYFLRIRENLPRGIAEPDRSWLALAAYNIGPAHLQDARALTERLGGNANLWADVRKHLPLLQQKKYYGTVKYGYARGRESVAYVQNIRHFRTILQWHDIRRAKTGNAPDKLLSLDDSFGSDIGLPL